MVFSVMLSIVRSFIGGTLTVEGSMLAVCRRHTSLKRCEEQRLRLRSW